MTHRTSNRHSCRQRKRHFFLAAQLGYVTIAPSARVNPRGGNVRGTMANSLSAKKRIRQNVKHRLSNKSVKSEIKTLTKNLLDSIEAKDEESAQKLYAEIVSKMDKAGRKHIYHRRTVARKKSQLAGRLKAAF